MSGDGFDWARSISSCRGRTGSPSPAPTVGGSRRCWPPSSAACRWPKAGSGSGPSVVVGELDQHRARLDAGRDLLGGFIGRDRTAARGGPIDAGQVRARSQPCRPAGRRPCRRANGPGPCWPPSWPAAPTVWSSTSPPTISTCRPSKPWRRPWSGSEGTLLVVSHDRWLLESLTVNRTWVVEGGRVHEGSPVEPPRVGSPPAHEDLHAKRRRRHDRPALRRPGGQGLRRHSAPTARSTRPRPPWAWSGPASSRARSSTGCSCSSNGTSTS